MFSLCLNVALAHFLVVSSSSCCWSAVRGVAYVILGSKLVCYYLHVYCTNRYNTVWIFFEHVWVPRVKTTQYALGIGMLLHIEALTKLSVNFNIKNCHLKFTTLKINLEWAHATLHTVCSWSTFASDDWVWCQIAAWSSPEHLQLEGP